MASLKRVQRSPFWYIRRRDLETGRWIDESTPFRRGVPADDRRAHKKADAYTAAEARVRPESGTAFTAWVPSYITSHYGRENTLRRAEAAWLNLRDFLRDHRLTLPRQIRYQHAADYLAWRKSRGAGHNTARMEIKFLSFLLNEAVRREYADHNPIAQAKIQRTAVPEKPEIPDADIILARAYFVKHRAADWMRDVFEILMHLGCRFAEASIPVADIDFESLTIRLTDSKRKDHDPRRIFIVPITPAFATWLRKFEVRERTVPVLTRTDNQRFNEMLRRAAGTTSHSFRVSFITRCARAGLSEQECMRLVNHSSRLVHKIYTRLNVEDSRRALARVPPPPAPPLPVAQANRAPSARSFSSRKKGNPSA